MPDPQATPPQGHADDELIVRYLDGRLNEQAFAELNERLKEDPAFRNRFIELTMQAHHLSALVGKPDLAMVQEELLLQKPGAPGVRISLPMRYRVGLTLSAAAVLALALTLVFLLTGGDEPIQPRLSVDTAQPPANASVVATLTAERDAVWDQQAGGGLRPGTPLTVGRRLTLTRGFAEITTQSGAVAILEAPAMIELLGTPNALHLHAGKLVGICETESSKGLLIRTPQVDITDLGTRFGVALGESGEAYTHVFEGSVAVTNSASTGETSRPRVLMTGESLAVDSSGTQVRADASEPARFTQALAWYGDRPQLTGDIQWSSNLYSGVDHQRWPIRPQAVIFQDMAGAELSQDFPTALMGVGGDRPSWDGNITAGTALRSYIVLSNPGRQTALTGSITFEHPIRSVIRHAPNDQKFVQAMGHPNAKAFPHPEIWINHTDQVWFEDGGRTVSFDFKSNGEVNLIRIIVLEQNEPNQP